MRKRSLILVGGLVGVAAGWALANSHPPLETVSIVDVNRYLGRWYEIARYPNRFERKCARDVTAHYSIKANGEIRVVNSCITPAGSVTRSVGTAKIVDKSGHAKLKVTFFWPFYGNYWIIGLGPDYEYAVVGEPSRKFLWVLGRVPQMSDELYLRITSQLASKGYDASKLLRTPQTGTR
jgi:apolipoprotein D and lipocalin family protein